MRNHIHAAHHGACVGVVLRFSRNAYFLGGCMACWTLALLFCIDSHHLSKDTVSHIIHIIFNRNSGLVEANYAFSILVQSII
ncbi:hypothetical protein NA56DRAFT_704864 [Hyaloscypha hepaticicola]|uniref:Uncharacterized protein n=1 Tax=Hyaloscypha hepaticicola TaxID=2082293 RepID=A0A2J6Q1B2_9HELO|nr:hypothetical protein NA56DRAFT_704864 [Hyaloscypha hepaticicola]